MQVVCGNCQLSFQAPDGATGLVCPICRTPLRAPDAPPETAAGTAQQVMDWSGGTLDELVSLLSGPAWSARVEVFAGNATNPVGEVHVIAGGVSDAIFDGASTHDALDKLRAVKNGRFRVETRLPNPSDGDLTFPGPDHGKLEERPLAHLMRYCEAYVLTAGIEVWRGSENAKVDYRRGEIVGVTVGGIDAPERLGEVMKWSSGNYRLMVPRLTIPDTAPKAAAPAAPAASRPSAATSKTIFGMPALDPAALAAATERAKAAQASGAATSPTPAPGMGRGSASAPSSGGLASARGSSTAGSVTPSPAVSPPPAESATPRPPGGSAAATSAPAAPARSPTPVATPAIVEPAGKGGRTAPAAPAGAPATAARSATTPAPGASGPAGEADRTGPSKTAPKPAAPVETPVWTYVGVGFVFGLALLGVYRLVIVLAH